jgi:hypothetical protein
MATRATVCPMCREAVPGGRLACPSCGHLLATVAGAPRRRAKKPVAPTAADPEGIPATVAVDRSSMASPLPASKPLTAPSRPSSTRTSGDLPPAGAYVPPGATSPGPFLLPARAWAGVTSASPRPMATAGPSPAIAMAGSVTAMTRAVPSPPAPDRPATVAVDEEVPDTTEASWLEAAAGWLMIIGSAVAILGFLLPWSRSVIGASGVGSFFDTWGIASPSHVLVVLALAAALGLAVVANPIPTWIRTCCAGLLLGGLLVGLSWPYVLGPLGAGPGVLAVLLGGVLLAGAGVLDLVEARHVPAAPPV